MELTIDQICAAVAAHYTAKFSHPIYCTYDDGTLLDNESRFDIQGRGIPVHPDLHDRYPAGWSMLDHVSWIDAVNITLASKES